MNKQKAFDLTFLEQMDDENFLVEVITLYLHDTHVDLKEMKAGFDAGNSDRIYRIAHKLKSSTGMLQANTMYSILEQTESMAKEGKENSQLGMLVEMACFEFSQLRTGLESYLRQTKAAV